MAYNGGAFAGAATEDAGRIRELIPVLSEPVAKAPGARAFVTQASLFGRSVGGSRGILIDVLGPDYESVEPAFRDIRRQVGELFPRKDGHQIRVRPSENAVSPELVVRPNPDALARAGVSARDFAQALDVYNDGILVREIPLGGELVELILTTQTRETAKIEDIADIPVIARDGSLVKIGQVAEVSIESAPNQLLRKAGRRVVTIELRLHESIPLETAIATINDQVVIGCAAEEFCAAAGDLGHCSDCRNRWYFGACAFKPLYGSTPRYVDDAWVYHFDRCRCE